MKALNSRLIFNSMSAAIEFKGIVQMFKLSAHLSALLIKCPNPYVVTLISAGLTVQSDGRGMKIAGPKAGLAKSLSLSITPYFFYVWLKSRVCHLVLFWWVWSLAAGCFLFFVFLILHVYPYLPSLLWGNIPLVLWDGEHSFNLPKTIWIAWRGNVNKLPNPAVLLSCA